VGAAGAGGHAVAQNDPDDDDLRQDAEAPSKTALKRESQSLQELGETLASLPSQVLAGLPLPESLRDAIAQLKRIKSRGAARRQRQYIGKIMRELDAEPLRQALRQWDLSRRRQAEDFHQVERWRDRFMEEGESATAAFLEQYPAADRQQLRALLRALPATAAPRSPKAARSLFRFLRDTMRAREDAAGSQS